VFALKKLREKDIFKILSAAKHVGQAEKERAQKLTRDKAQKLTRDKAQKLTRDKAQKLLEAALLSAFRARATLRLLPCLLLTATP